MYFNYSFLDQLILEMNAWFSDAQRKAVLGLSLVPAAMEKDWKAKAQDLGEIYHDDLPDADNLSVEHHCWQLKWDGHQGKCQVIRIKHCHMQTVLKITYTLSVTNCECERSNSALKHLKLTTFYNGTWRVSRLAL